VSRLFSIKPAARLALIALPCLLGGACSSGPASDSVTFTKPSSFFATPDWMKDTTPAEGSLWRPVSPEDYAGPDGRCAGGNIQPAGPEGEARPEAAPLTSGGVGLGMSECDVIRRIGPTDNFQIGSNERGERMVTMTYVQGARPGIYRFQSGRLASIERGAEPPPAPKVAKPKPKPAAPRAAAVTRPQPAPQQPQAAPQPGSAPWPAPQPAAQPQAAPWPQPGRPTAPQQSSPWPAPQPPRQQSSPWPSQ
jgi:hypothetical protein